MIAAREKSRENALIFLFKKVWQYSAGNRRMVALYWALFVCAMVVSLLGQPMAFARMADFVTTNTITEENVWYLWKLLLLTGLIDLVFWCFHGPARLIEQRNAFLADANYKSHLLEGTMLLPIAWHAEHHTGDTIDKIKKGTQAIHHFAENSFLVIYGVVQFIVSFIVLAYFSGALVAIVVGMIALSIIITIRFDRVLVGQYDRINKLENSISESVTDTISNIVTVIFLRVEARLYRFLDERIRSPYALVIENQRLCEIKWWLTSMCCTAMVIFVFGAYFYRHIGSGKMPAGEFVLMSQYLRNMCDLFFKITSMYGEILQERSRVENAELLAADFTSERMVNHVLPADWRRFEVRDLNFAYDDPSEAGARLNLANVSFSVSRGERIAVVGGSGSGKSTFFKVVRGLYAPQDMRLCVDGKLVPEGFIGVSRSFGIVPQDPEIFGGTIEKNITFGQECPRDLIRRFTDIACFTAVADRLPKGFESAVNEKGVNLSGGERQRLALARGLLASSDQGVLLLDEALSSVDTATEMAVYRNIFREFSGKTIIASTHRLHMLRLFDRIFVFDKGCLVGAGTLDELLASCPSFIAQWQAAEVPRDTREYSLA